MFVVLIIGVDVSKVGKMRIRKIATSGTEGAR